MARATVDTPMTSNPYSPLMELAPPLSVSPFRFRKKVATDAVGVSVIPLAIVIARDGTIATMAGAHAFDIEKQVVALFGEMTAAFQILSNK